MKHDTSPPGQTLGAPLPHGPVPAPKVPRGQLEYQITANDGTKASVYGYPLKVKDPYGQGGTILAIRHWASGLWGIDHLPSGSCLGAYEKKKTAQVAAESIVLHASADILSPHIGQLELAFSEDLARYLLCLKMDEYSGKVYTFEEFLKEPW